MFKERICRCIGCDKNLFQLLLNNSCFQPIEYSSNCPYCGSSSFTLIESTTTVTACDGLFIDDIVDVSENKMRIKIEKKK